MIKAVIFDLDGTLIDSLDPIYQHHMQVADKFGLRKYSFDEVMCNSGMGWHALLRKLWPETDSDWFIEEYKKFARETYPAFPGAVEAIKSLREKEISLGVVTGKIHSASVRRLEEAGFGLDWFEFIHGEDDQVANKPDGKAFERALEVLGLNPNEVAYVGDAVNDMLAAKAAGLGFIAVLTGYGKRGDFEGEEIINSVAGIAKVIK